MPRVNFVKRARIPNAVVSRKDIARARKEGKDSDGMEGGFWSNGRFEQDDCEVGMGAGDDAIEMPEDYEQEW